MQFPAKTGAPASQRTACAIIPLFEGRRLAGAAKVLDEASGGLLRRLLRTGDASATPGRTLLVPTAGEAAPARLLLVGCGKRESFDAKRFTEALTAAIQALAGTGVREAISYLAYEPMRGLEPYYAARLSVETARSTAYRFDELKSRSDAERLRLTRLGIGIGDRGWLKETRRGVTHGQAIANGADLARDLGNRPANVCTPSHLADAARELARGHKRLRLKVLDENEMKRLNMGALLSVTNGATEPARLIVLEYRGTSNRAAPIAICGKGVTFDTGGISLKPPSKMDEMKFDMCGAAGVLGTLAAVAELELEVNVVGVVPACENMPGGQATRPGDIVKSMSGQTVEILNTDAEGRLILSDAMTYARQFEPRYLLDVATLTGACVIALGHAYTGLFSNDEHLAARLLSAGERSLDRAWRLPVGEEYGESLKSNFADFANSGSRDGSASIAANFLSRFVEAKQAWAHLDIAGVAWRSDANKGATGRPVALLTDFLLNLESDTA
jgi:leucyl aminopeptidase